MRYSPRKLINTLVIVFCLLIMTVASAALLGALPDGQASKEVSSLQTGAVFETDTPNIEPEREEAFEGEVDVPIVEELIEEQAPPAPAEPEVPKDSAWLSAEAVLAQMTDEEKIWQLFFATPEAVTGYPKVTRAADATRDALAARPVGGIVYFPQNLENYQQAATLLSNTRSYCKIPAFLGINEEGGAMRHLTQSGTIGITPLESMAVYGSNADEQVLYKAVASLAGSMARLGFNMNFAPVADVAYDAQNAVIANRSFGTKAEVVSELTASYVKALQDNSIASCLKHFPGYGSIALGQQPPSTLSRTAEELMQQDLSPFSAGISSGAYFVMDSHLRVPSVTGDDTPSDLSGKVVTELLREKLAFENIIITESHSDSVFAEQFACGEAAVQALEAGVDMILMPKDLQAAYNSVSAAVKDGRLSMERIEQSVLRILQVKVRLGLLEDTFAS